MHPAVAGNHLVFVISNRTNESRREDAIFLNAVDEILHLCIVGHAKWMIAERMNLRNLNLHRRLFSGDAEHLLHGHQFDLLPRTLFHAVTPPSF